MYVIRIEESIQIIQDNPYFAKYGTIWDNDKKYGL